MWLWLSLTALLCWSGSDLFSKIGCRDGSDRYSHLKMVIAEIYTLSLHDALPILPAGVPAVYQFHGFGLSGPAVYRAVRFFPHL